jgi:hypothetical protein
MIANPAAATILFNAAYDAYTGVYSALEKISGDLPADELTAVKQAVGRVMGDILMELTEPILQQHPDLLPAEWRQIEGE